MPGKYLLMIFLISLSCSGICQSAKTRFSTIQLKFAAAEKLFNSEQPTEASDARALHLYSEVIEANEASPLIIFKSYLRCGNLLDIAKSYPMARLHYSHALELQKREKSLSDSLAFAALIYDASAWYNLNNFEKAKGELQEAEALISRYPGLPDKERMYNALGAIYFENGNYQQSRNYFTKALETVRLNARRDQIMEINFATNIASSLFKLGLNAESLKIYREMLRQQHVPNYIFLNRGKVEAAMGNYDAALNSFRQVNAHESPGVYNELGYAHFKNGNIDSAIWYLDKFSTVPNVRETHRLDNGINFLYHGEVLSRQLNFRDAIAYLQKGIVTFSGTFSENDRYKNPTAFSGSFNPYNLYYALLYKAQAFEALFRRQSDETFLKASLNSYESALDLLRYIERSYETDDAKIFLKNQSQDVYLRALHIAIELHLLFPEKDYLEKAFQISEKNKASIISSQLQTKNVTGLPSDERKLLEEEQRIKSQLARLNIKMDQLVSEAQVEANKRERMDAEIALGQVQRRLEQNSTYFKARYDNEYPSIHAIQEHLNEQQAVVSFKINGDIVHVFIVTKKDLQYERVDSFNTCRKNIAAWLDMLSDRTQGRRFTGEGKAAKLYEQLIQPIQALLPKNVTQWVIIPDGVLSYLPFESLPSGEPNKYLVQTTEISYALSARFIYPAKPFAEIQQPATMLAVAPFASVQPIASRSSDLAIFPQLPNSADEIANLGGVHFMDKDATKAKFLQNFSRCQLIHLATHAISDPSSPAGSYIAFYPSGGSAMDNYLFLDEIYNLDMSGTKLTVISACESGTGKWVSNEGVMSMARAFTYAGCESTVQSMWKADDKSTAFILRKFHEYLVQGLSKSAALQRAKIDFLNSDALYKTPGYWAHLVLTGNAEPVFATSQSGRYKLILAIFLLVATSAFLLAAFFKKPS